MLRKEIPLLSSPKNNTIWSSISRLIHIDWPLFFGLLTLMVIGLIVLYSAGGHNMDIVLRQLARFGLGFAAMLAIAQISPATYQRWSPWLFGLGVVLLILVAVMGDTSKGAQRWLDLGPIRFQPSEIMRMAVPMMIAWLLAHSSLPPHGGRVIAGALLVALPMGLIAKQPDLGTALLVGSSGACVLLLAGVRWRYVAIFLGTVAAAIPILWNMLHDYQRQRVITFLDPETDPLGAGYHIIQSKIAIGSGGVYGKGWLNGTQAYLDYIPERTTDFIFAVLGEEFGMAGIFFVLAVYMFVVLRGLYIAAQAQTTYTRLLAGSLTLTFSIYIFINTAMVTGLLPVVGVPLPLISYGGTSLVTVLASFGILMSIQTHRKLVAT